LYEPRLFRPLAAFIAFLESGLVASDFYLVIAGSCEAFIVE